jgi:16S rRNA (cytosine1402-N4)-methyltransferase
MGHQPVLAAAVSEHLVWDRDGLYVDGTIGCAMHARGILDRLTSKGRLWGFDWDEQMLDVARRQLASEQARVRLFDEPFSQIGLRLQQAGERAHGIFLDLGLNSAVLDDSSRGFTYRDASAALDMRMDRRRQRTAARLINEGSEHELMMLFKNLGEARSPRAAARAIVQGRKQRPLQTAGDLVTALRRGGALRGGASELSRLWQAIRYWVTEELDDLDHFLAGVADWLLPQGRLVVLSYESLCDRRVKALHSASGSSRTNRFRLLTRRALRPDREEIRTNPRARSAKLRAMERIA